MTRFLTDEGEPRAVVIVTSSRSGSNLLVTYLRQLRMVASFGEIFRADFPEIDAWQQLRKRLSLPADAAELHQQDLVWFWELVLTTILERKRWASAKIFYYHRRDNPIWKRFEAEDHRIIHLWRDATFDQYVSRLLAFESGRWRAGAAPSDSPDGDTEPVLTVPFDRDEYLAFRAERRADFEATRARYGSNGRYMEIEYRDLTDHAHMATMLEGLFGERVDIEERLRRQVPRPKIEHVADPDAAAPFAHDSIRDGFAPA